MDARQLMDLHAPILYSVDFGYCCRSWQTLVAATWQTLVAATWQTLVASTWQTLVAVTFNRLLDRKLSRVVTLWTHALPLPWARWHRSKQCPILLYNPRRTLHYIHIVLRQSNLRHNFFYISPHPQTTLTTSSFTHSFKMNILFLSRMIYTYHRSPHGHPASQFLTESQVI